ncbi:hypothetical protein PPERSA_11413 [Pseudocohnilembus persalinus]|uniref:Tetratricopeptide repeat protein n=1 Tax=Pseudocohnilembus persalinus TaxID=266149 RepID=A0A0V0QQ34_PSEPJ|nr:hypothetical protein PPERSA_11413 [Pseudocohnilembus persalinus]|eukprot:KRX04289.1 hypothetical protein PPERSA_11413 [Pseudocohnilembus persalinus]
MEDLYNNNEQQNTNFFATPQTIQPTQPNPNNNLNPLNIDQSAQIYQQIPPMTPTQFSSNQNQQQVDNNGQTQNNQQQNQSKSNQGSQQNISQLNSTPQQNANNNELNNSQNNMDSSNLGNKNQQNFQQVQQALQPQKNQLSQMAIQAASKIDKETLFTPPSKEYVAKHLDNYLLQGKIFVLQNDFAQAQKVYEIIVEHCPHQGNSWVLCGRTAFMQKEYMKAMLAYQQALQKNTMAQLENYSSAESAFNRVLSLEPNFQPFKGTIIIYLAIIKKLNYNYRAALDLLIKALKEGGYTIQQTVAILCNIGYCLEMLKEKETLEIIWKMDTSSYEKSFDCLFMTAKCYEAQSRFKEAIVQYDKSFKLNPQHAVGLCVMGVSFYNFKINKMAFQCFQRAYQNDPSQLESLFNIALLYEISRNFSEAINIYNKLLQINPDDSEVIRRKNLIESGNFEHIDQEEQKLPMREPEFKIKVQLWLENQNSSYIPTTRPQSNIIPQRPQVQDQQKQTEKFSNWGQNENIEDFSKSNAFLPTPLINPYPNNILQQSPVQQWQMNNLDEEGQNNLQSPIMFPSTPFDHNQNLYSPLYPPKSPMKPGFQISTAYRKPSGFMLQPPTPLYAQKNQPQTPLLLGLTPTYPQRRKQSDMNENGQVKLQVIQQPNNSNTDNKNTNNNNNQNKNN